MGDRRFSTRRCRLGPSRGRFPGGDCLVEAARLMWNNVLLAFIHLAGACSGAGGGPVGLELTGSAGPGGLRLGVLGRQVMAAMQRFGVGGAASVFAAARLVDLFPVHSAFWRIRQIQAWESVGRVPGRWSSFVFVVRWRSPGPGVCSR